jgi:FkbM family methyltransferase
MTAREWLRRRARAWAATHDFPLRRELLVDHHNLPAARLRKLSDLLIPAQGEDAVEVVDVGNDLRLQLDLTVLAQRAIAYRLSDESELALLATLLRAGDVVLDVGANVGLYTLVASRLVGDLGLVHAFEPAPATADVLQHNLDLNAIRNVVVHRTAVASSSGRATLRLPVPGEPGLATIVGGAGTVVAEVSTLRLDEFLRAHSLESVALLKVDVEGAELAVLEGAGELLGDSIRCILFEVLNGSTEVQSYLAARGFRLHVVQPPGASDLTRPCRPDEPFAYANILALS